MDSKRAYYDVLTRTWKTFGAALEVAPMIKDPQDRRWVDICDALERIEADVPPELSYYAGSMVAIHMDVLERMWRK